MIEVSFHGYPASFTPVDGWRCTEKLVERFLREHCTPAEGTPEHEAEALKLAANQFAGSILVIGAPGVVTKANITQQYPDWPIAN